jgi:hypothetical protein
MLGGAIINYNLYIYNSESILPATNNFAPMIKKLGEGAYLVLKTRPSF